MYHNFGFTGIENVVTNHDALATYNLTTSVYLKLPTKKSQSDNLH